MLSNSLNPENQNESIEISSDVLEHLASRICHDLISPIGAIHNGVEFVEEMGMENAADAMGLIAMSTTQATSKLKAFRLAYGTGGRDPSIKLEDVHDTFSKLLSNDNKAKLNWDHKSPIGQSEEIPLGFCKILMGSLMLSQEFLPKGGTISVMAGDSEGETIIRSEGLDAAPHDNMGLAIKQRISHADLTPRLVHPYVLSVIGKNYGFDLALSAPEKDVMLLIIKKTS